MTNSDYSLEDKILFSSLKEGKEEAFSYVFQTYYNLLFNYAGRIVKDPELANDLVQETFCRLYENRDKINLISSLKSYLYKSVYNGCLDAIKHQKVKHNYINSELLDLYFAKIIQTPEAEMALSDQEINDAIQEAVSKLPQRCREIFILSKIEGLSNKKIAEELNISMKTVENQMTIAFKRLRKDLEWLLCLICIVNF